jgi:plasmid stabilization system protein ParE
MAHRVVWSPRALADVQGIALFIASDSPAYAKAVVRRIIDLTRSLSQFPEQGRKVPEFDDDTLRELQAYSYRIIYRVEESQVVIATVVHGRRILDL